MTEKRTLAELIDTQVPKLPAGQILHTQVVAQVKALYLHPSVGGRSAIFDLLQTHQNNSGHSFSFCDMGVATDLATLCGDIALYTELTDGDQNAYAAYTYAESLHNLHVAKITLEFLEASAMNNIKLKLKHLAKDAEIDIENKYVELLDVDKAELTPRFMRIQHRHFNDIVEAFETLARDVCGLFAIDLIDYTTVVVPLVEKAGDALHEKAENLLEAIKNA